MHSPSSRALTLIVFLVMHLFVFTNYTGNVFHEESFVAQYSSGIYRYPVLGRELLLLTNDIVRTFVPEGTFSLPRDPDASRSFYLSHLIVNGLFTIATSVVLYEITFLRKDDLRDIDLASYLYFLLVLGLSYSVVTPYDQIAYFFLATSLLATEREPIGSQSRARRRGDIGSAVERNAGLVHARHLHHRAVRRSLLATAAAMGRRLSSRRLRRVLSGTALSLRLRGAPSRAPSRLTNQAPRP